MRRAVLALVALAAPVLAEGIGCDHDTPSDAAVGACTAALREGGLTAEHVAHIYAVRGFHHAALQELDKARADFDALLQLVPGDPHALVSLAGLDQFEDQPERALERIEGLAIEDPTLLAAALRIRVAAHLDLGEVGAAHRFLARAALGDEELARTKRDGLRTLRDAGALDAALAWLSPWVADDRWAATRTAGLLVELDRHPQALPLLDRLIAEEATGYLLDLRAGVHFEAGDLEAEIADRTRLVALDPSPRRERALGYALFSAGRYEEAIAALQPHAADPDHAGAVLGRIAESQYWLGRYAEAAETYEAAAQHPVRHLEAIRFYQGRALQKLGRREEAVAAMVLAVAAEPDSARALNEAAWLLLGLGRADEALPYARRANAAWPDNLNIRDTLAVAQCHTGDPSGARATYLSILNHPDGAAFLATDLGWEGGDLNIIAAVRAYVAEGCPIQDRL